MATTREYTDYLNDQVDIAPANSQEELQAAEVIEEIFVQHGLETQIQEFETPAFSGLTSRVYLVLLFLGVLLSGFLGTPVAVVGLIIAAVAFVLLAVAHGGNDVLGSAGPRATSQNVIGVHRATGPNVIKGNRPIVIVAHYDTPRENFLNGAQLAKWQPLIKRLSWPSSVAVMVLAATQALPFIPALMRHALWVLGVLLALPLLLLGASAIYERFAACTTGASDNKASVAAMLGVLDMVRPAGDAAKEWAESHPQSVRREPEDELDGEDWDEWGEDDWEQDESDAQDEEEPGQGPRVVAAGSTSAATRAVAVGEDLEDEQLAQDEDEGLEEQYLEDEYLEEQQDSEDVAGEDFDDDSEDYADGEFDDEAAYDEAEEGFEEYGEPEVDEYGLVTPSTVRRGAKLLKSLQILPDTCEIVYENLVPRDEAIERLTQAALGEEDAEAGIGRLREAAGGVGERVSGGLAAARAWLTGLFGRIRDFFVGLMAHLRGDAGMPEIERGEAEDFAATLGTEPEVYDDEYELDVEDAERPADAYAEGPYDAFEATATEAESEPLPASADAGDEEFDLGGTAYDGMEFGAVDLGPDEVPLAEVDGQATAEPVVQAEDASPNQLPMSGDEPGAVTDAPEDEISLDEEVPVALDGAMPEQAVVDEGELVRDPDVVLWTPPVEDEPEESEQENDATQDLSELEVTESEGTYAPETDGGPQPASEQAAAGEDELALPEDDVRTATTPVMQGEQTVYLPHDTYASEYAEDASEDAYEDEDWEAPIAAPVDAEYELLDAQAGPVPGVPVEVVDVPSMGLGYEIPGLMPTSEFEQNLAAEEPVIEDPVAAATAEEGRELPATEAPVPQEAEAAEHEEPQAAAYDETERAYEAERSYEPEPVLSPEPPLEQAVQESDVEIEPPVQSASNILHEMFLTAPVQRRQAAPHMSDVLHEMFAMRPAIEQDAASRPYAAAETEDGETPVATPQPQDQAEDAISEQRPPAQAQDEPAAEPAEGEEHATAAAEPATELTPAQEPGEASETDEAGEADALPQDVGVEGGQAADEPELKPEAELEMELQPLPEEGPEPAMQVVYESQAAGDPEPAVQPEEEPMPQMEPAGRQEPEPEPAQAPDLQAEKEPEPAVQPEEEPDSSSQPKAAQEPEPVSQPEEESQPQPEPAQNPEQEPADAAPSSPDPNATELMARLVFSTESDVSDEELADKDVTGLTTISAEAEADVEDSLPVVDERIPRPRAVDDPNWGKSNFKPATLSAGRRAMLLDLPDPSVMAVDSLAPAQEGQQRQRPASGDSGEVASRLELLKRIPSPLDEPPAKPKEAPEDKRSSATAGEQTELPRYNKGKSIGSRSPKKNAKRKMRFGRKPKEEQQMESLGEWLGLGDDYDAKKDGRQIGSWDNFDDEGRHGKWKGGATMRAGLRGDTDEPSEPEEGFVGLPNFDALDLQPRDDQQWEDRMADESQAPDPETMTELREAVLRLGDDDLIAHDIWFVGVGASSLDHAGIKAFLDEHRRDIRGAFLVNLDSVGAGKLTLLTREGMGRKRRADRRMGRMITNIAEALHIDLGHADYSWDETDATPAMQRSVRVGTLMGMSADGVAAHSHTSADEPEYLDDQQIANVADIVAELIRRA